MSFFNSNSMDKLGSRLASIVSTASEKVKEAAERTLTKETPLERNLREAVSDKNWGCPTSVLSEIARASHNFLDFPLISRTMWAAISEAPKRWRKIFKGLTMLEYMLKNGPERFAEEARDRTYLLKSLQSFNWSEEGRDKGAGIREKAGICTTLVFDAEELKAARETAAKNRDKYIGISSASSVGPRSSSSSSSSRGQAAAAVGFGSSAKPSSQSDASRGDSGMPSSVSSRSMSVKEKKGAPATKGGPTKSDSSSSTASAKSSRQKAPVQQADLLGFDSPPLGLQGAPSVPSPFASGTSVWADPGVASQGAEGASSSSSSSSLAGFLLPPPPGSNAAAGSSSNGAGKIAAADAAGSSSSSGGAAGGSDDLFGGFQAATPNPTAAAPGTLAGSSTSLDAVAAAFAAPAAPAAAAPEWANGVGGGFESSSSLGNFSGFQTASAGTNDPGSGAQGAAAAPQLEQWQQPFTMGSNSSSGSSSNSSSGNANTLGFTQPFTLGGSNPSGNSSSSSNSNMKIPQPFSMSGNSGANSQPFSLGSSSSSGMRPSSMGAGAAAPQPFSLGGSSAQPWQQQQQQQQAASSFTSGHPGLF
ncbi:EPN3 protein, putative [Eimeria acervulina]|uniref:EPN3 protein, putative n=1 Tax=Eimeria acervulina TaxID=5801 RepID=U6GI66_EIMAC|nr:EPN3 protein, putative [Eimeria acervulina]CDI78274.1 EPN3 protein, putative [Eimeria acervulina]